MEGFNALLFLNLVFSFMQDVRVFSLSEVTKSIERTITSRYSSEFWVKAEMLKLNYYTYSGHAFPDLVEKENGVIVTQMRAIIWASDFKRISEKFSLAGVELTDGTTILCKASIKYNGLYGLSLRISDIDTAFSLGELEKEKNASIEKLTEEKIFDLNKKTVLADLPKRLAVISVETGKGYQDFVNIISSHKEFGIFHKLFPSLLQGDGAVNTLILSLEKIREVKEFFNAALIIRGGGGDIGMACYNNFELCKTIATFPIPVITGIGHSTNLTVSEMVSYHNGITPTDVADFIIKRFQQATENLERMESMLKIKSEYRLQKEREQLNLMEKYINVLNPQSILNKGYSITYLNGKVLKSEKDIKKGDYLITKLAEGEVKSIVE